MRWKPSAPVIAARKGLTISRSQAVESQPRSPGYGWYRVAAAMLLPRLTRKNVKLAGFYEFVSPIRPLFAT